MPPSRKPRSPTPIARGPALAPAAAAPAALPGTAERARKVRTLRRAIADGTYQPDPHEIAREMLEQGL